MVYILISSENLKTSAANSLHTTSRLQLFLWIALAFIVFIALLAAHYIYKTVSHLTGHNALTTPMSASDPEETAHFTTVTVSRRASTSTTDTEATVVEPYTPTTPDKPSKFSMDEKKTPCLIVTSPSLSLKDVPVTDFTSFPPRDRLHTRRNGPPPLIALGAADSRTKEDPSMLSPKFIARERRRMDMRGRELARSKVLPPPPRSSSRMVVDDDDDDDDDDEPLYRILERKRSTSPSPKHILDDESEDDQPLYLRRFPKPAPPPPAPIPIFV